MSRMARAAARTLGGITLAGLGGIAYAGLIERNLFTVRRYTLPVLPPGYPPVRILQVSDLHLTPGQRRKIEWVRQLAQLQPDLVINSGDNLGHLDSVPGVLTAMEPLFDRPGVFVLGSNDYWAPKFKNPARYLTSGYAKAPSGRQRLPVKELVAGFRDGGWLDLNNARTTLTIAGTPLEFVGVNDPHVNFDRYAHVTAPADPRAALTIGLVHAPYQRILNAMVDDGAGLIVAGHTHGGQLALPFFGALVTNCDIDRSRAKGISRWWNGAGSSSLTGGRGLPQPRVREPNRQPLSANSAQHPTSDDGITHPLSDAGPKACDSRTDRARSERTVAPPTALHSRFAPPDAAYLHVSAGLGTSPFAPVRFACRPEATLLTLVTRSGV